VLLELLGEGGQGAVWKAEDLLHPGSLVALKLVPLALSRPSDVERVRREARALARLEHPTLVACHALFEDLKLGVLGIAMDFVDGAALRKHEEDPRLSPEHRALVLGHIARVLAYVHQRGVAHRDLKLDNVLVTRNFWSAPQDPQNVKLVDFGIAKVDTPAQPLTQLDTIIGTLAYLAPEQLDPAHFGAGSPQNSDVFAFGILGWRLLYGGHPSGLPSNASVVEFAATYRRVFAAGSGWPPAAPPGPWGQLLCDCLALRARDRIPNGEELARRCEQVLASGAPPAAALPKTEAFASSPTWLARPSPALDQTVDLAPLAVSASQPGTTRPELAARRDATATPRPLPAPPPRAFPWLTWLGVMLGLGIAGGAAYYALFVNLPEGMPPPLPSSVGSLTRPVEPLDAGAGEPSDAPRDAMPPNSCAGSPWPTPRC
jgi:serine/threonine-protein kinase